MAITNVTFEQSKKTRLFMPYLRFLHSCVDASSPRAVILKRMKSRLEMPLGFHTRVSEHSPAAKKIKCFSPSLGIVEAAPLLVGETLGP